jgi:hypothetical protein
MPLNATVQRGFTATAGIPVTTDDLNAGFLPTVDIEGSVGSSDLGAGSTNSTHIVPGPIAYVATTGSANAYVAAPSPALTALTTGSWLALKANHTNTGAATLNVNSLGAVAIRKQTDTALEAGDIRSGQVFWVTYDGTYWQLTSPEGLARKTYGEAAGTTNAYTLTLTDIVTTLAALTGRVLLFKANAANTGACTLNVNSLGATSIKKLDGTDPSGGDLPNAKLIAVAYDGTNFQLLGGTSSASLPDVVTAGTYATPSSVTVDAKGRITSITAGTALTAFSGSAVSVPAAGAAVTPQAHSLGSVPRNAHWVLVNVTGDAGYTTGQEIPLHDVGSPVSGTDDQVPCFAAVRDGTNLGLVRSSAATTLSVAHASTGVFTTITEVNWQVKPYAIK